MCQRLLLGCQVFSRGTQQSHKGAARKRMAATNRTSAKVDEKGRAHF
jgi:hypothetical protein